MPLRLAYVVHMFPKVSETFIAHELAELRRRGVEVRVLSLLPPREELRHDFIAAAGLDRLVSYEPAEFSRIIKAFKPDLLHAHFATEPTAVARELSAQHGVPFTFTAHGYDIRRKPPADFAARAAAAARVVTVSEANVKWLVEKHGVPRGHITIIPCGVDTENFRPVAASRESAAIPRESDGRALTRRGYDGVPLIVCVARHVAVKNLGLLLDACALLHQQGVKFRCVSVGDGPLRGELELKREQLGLNEVIEFTGALTHEEVLAWWQRADLATLTSENEGMPVCLMEAGACEVPVVATAVGGIPELVTHGETGLLAPRNDPPALAAAFRELMENPDRAAAMGRAARRRVQEKFSLMKQVDDLLAIWSEILSATPRAEVESKVKVSDPFGATNDPELPTVALALNPAVVNDEFRHTLERLVGAGGRVSVRRITVTRHKAGKRAVIEYGVRLKPAAPPWQNATLIGKIRTRRFGNEPFRLQEAIWNAGFQADSADGVSVPEPLAVIPSLKMWLQRKVPGEVASKLLAGPDGVALARRIAEAIHKLHRANVPTERAHSMADELRILHECLGKLSAAQPTLQPRLARILAACDRLAASVPAPRTCGIHRDFYPAQVIVDGARLWLIDFDLYCQGDPGLDLGNFIGHITEESLRQTGDAGARRDREQAMEDRFVELSGEAVRASVRAYTTLTLVRHIYLSAQFPERAGWTEPMVELCEERLGL